MRLDNRLWVVVTVLLCGALVAGGWFLGVQPQLAAMGAADAQRATVTSQNDALAVELAQLRAASSKEDELDAELQRLTQAVPPAIEGSAFLAEIDGLVTANHVGLDSFTLGAAASYVAPRAAAPAPSAGGAGPSASPSPSPSASAADAPSAATGPATVAPLTDPLITAADFVTVPVDLKVTGTTDQVAGFLADLQKGPRLVLVSRLDRRLDERTGAATLALHGTIYVLSGPAGAAAAFVGGAG